MLTTQAAAAAAGTPAAKKKRKGKPLNRPRAKKAVQKTPPGHVTQPRGPRAAGAAQHSRYHTPADIQHLRPRIDKAKEQAAMDAYKRRSRAIKATKAALIKKLSAEELLQEAVEFAVVNDVGYTKVKDNGFRFPQSETVFRRAKAAHKRALAGTPAPPPAAPRAGTAPTGRRVTESLFTPSFANDFDPRYMFCPEDDASLVMWINLMARSMDPPTEEDFRDNVRALPPLPPRPPAPPPPATRANRAHPSVLEWLDARACVPTLIGAPRAPRPAPRTRAGAVSAAAPPRQQRRPH